MYFLYLAIAILAFVFNMLIATSSKKQADDTMGVVPVVQLVFIIPIFVISSLIFYFTQSTSLGIDYQHLYILVPFLLEILFFAFTKELFTIFKADGFIIRSYILAIGLASITVFFLNWLFVKIF